MSGSVQIFIIKATNLHSKPMKHKPTVTVKYIDGGNIRKRKTSTYGVDKEDQDVAFWNEEFIIFLKDRHLPITLKVRDEHGKLGEGLLDLKNLESAVYKDLWIPLAGNEHGGKINVGVIYTESGLQPKHSEKIFVAPRFRIGLEKRNFFAGEVLKGILFFNAALTTKIEFLKIYFRGRHLSIKGAKIYKFTNFLKLQIKVAEKTTIAPGQYAVPFEIMLPTDIPASFRTTSFRYTIDYSIIARIKTNDYKEKIDLPLNMNVHIPLVGTGVSSNKKKNFKKNNGPITLDVTNTDSVNYIGAQTTFNVTIDNSSDLEVRRLKFKLKQKFNLHKDKKKIYKPTKNRVVRHIYKNDAIFPIKNNTGNVTKFQAILNVPAHDGNNNPLPPSTAPHTSMIDVIYFWKVTAILSNKHKLKVKLPVTLANNNPNYRAPTVTNRDLVEVSPLIPLKPHGYVLTDQDPSNDLLEYWIVNPQIMVPYSGVTFMPGNARISTRTYYKEKEHSKRYVKTNKGTPTTTSYVDEKSLATTSESSYRSSRSMSLSRSDDRVMAPKPTTGTVKETAAVANPAPVITTPVAAQEAPVPPPTTTSEVNTQ